MSLAPARARSERGGLLRAVLTLVAGGALAQALPLLLGPLLTRLYSPHEFGSYHLFAAVAANVAVIACARYEFALPLARDDDEAQSLRVLCLRLLTMVAALSTLVALAWAWIGTAGWAMWLPAAVAALGGVSLATLWATRAQRFRALAAARVVQYGGGSVLQAVAGALQLGVSGLIAAPIAAALGAITMLGLPLRGGGRRSTEELMEVAQRHREFPLLNTPHAFAGALQDTLAVALIAAVQGPAAAGFWGLTLRYLKAPATLVGSAVSQALYPRLAEAGALPTREARHAVRRVMGALALLAAPLVVLLWIFAPWAFEQAFGSPWREAGELARSLALYIGAHFVAAPLAVVTMAWNAQAWALKLALVGQVMFVVALALGLSLGGLNGVGWAVSIAMLLYFGWYFWKLGTWEVAA